MDGAQIPHIVLIEDNPSDIYLVNMALREKGILHRMTNFQTGVDALQALCPPSSGVLVPNLILMDLNTPCSNGLDVLRTIRATPALNQVPVAVISSSAAPGDKFRIDRIAGARYIEKPTQLRDFLQQVGNTVQEMLDSQQSSACGKS